MKAKISRDATLMLAAGLAGLGLIWWATRAGVTQKLAAGAVSAMGDVAVGTVKGIGQTFGVPDTNMTQCQRDLAAGNVLDASFSCPAGTYLGAVFGSTNVSAAQTYDARQSENVNAYP